MKRGRCVSRPGFFFCFANNAHRGRFPLLHPSSFILLKESHPAAETHAAQTHAHTTHAHAHTTHSHATHAAAHAPHSHRRAEKSATHAAPGRAIHVARRGNRNHEVG